MELTKTYQFPCSYTQLLVCEISVNLWFLLVCGGFQIILPALNHFQFGEWIGLAKIYQFPCSFAQLSMFPSKLRSFFFNHIYSSDYELVESEKANIFLIIGLVIALAWNVWLVNCDGDCEFWRGPNFIPLLSHTNLFFILFLSSPRIKRTPIWTLSETAALTTSNGQIPKTLSFRCNHHHFFWHPDSTRYIEL